jgi:acyl-CoA synthetase (AMP-forming)/AMP-acid ligase II
VLRDGWLLTHDVGYLDENGYLYVTDRRHFMIVSGGVNVFPSRVEAVLARHPSVEEAVVVGVPHPQWGEAVVAVIHSRSRVQETELEGALREHCAANLNGVERPKGYLFVESLARNANGKLRKHDIKAWAAAQQQALAW